MARKLTICFLLSLLLGFNSAAQSKNFTLGKWTEIHNSLLRELNRSYVDSLPVDRIERAGVDAMLSALDPYTMYIPEEENEDLRMMISKTYGGIGAVIYKPELDGYVIINEPYEGSPAQKFGIECCDEIMAIDGKTTKGLSSKEASDLMKGNPGSKVVFTVKKARTSQVKDITVTRESIHLPDIVYSGMLDASTGYIVQTGFTEGVASEFRESFSALKKKGMKKLVYDLRGNGGGILQEAVNIVSTFVPKGSLVVTARGKDGDNAFEYKTTLQPVDMQIPLVVLVDGGSASASEIVAGALQDLDRATIMGTRTFGKGLVQSIRPLPYNGQVKLTTAKYYTPSGRCVQAIDYSHRNEDGSVGSIPDSLTHEFRTASGRAVRDGGGITPDVVIENKTLSRLTYSLVLNGVVEQYALEYYRKHASIPSVDDFHFEDFAEFVEYAKGRDFDYRSSARTYFDQMEKELERDGLKESMSSQLEAMRDALDMEKEEFLNLKRDEIIPFIEEEIVIRYYFQRAGEKLNIRYDEQLKKALESPLIQIGQ